MFNSVFLFLAYKAPSKKNLKLNDISIGSHNCINKKNIKYLGNLKKGSMDRE